MAIQTGPRRQDEPPATPPAAWELSLEQIEQSFERQRPHVPPAERDVEAELQLVIAQQLRELIQVVRWLSKHPLLRRLY